MSIERNADSGQTQKVGPYTLAKVKPGVTSAGIEPTYATCTPDRWGMRYSDRDPERKGQLMYPLARDYAKAMQSLLLNQVQWGDAYFGPAGTTPVLKLTWPLDKDQFKRLESLLKPIMSSSLTNPAGGFGIPADAVPQVVSYKPADFLEQGSFAPATWKMQLNLSSLEDVFKIKQAASDRTGRLSQTKGIAGLADMIYHESRHCQQNFWIYALIARHPDNFEDIPNISSWPDFTSGKQARSSERARAVVSLAARQSVPDDTAALISLKRMAVAMYLQTLALWRRTPDIPSYLADMAALEAEYQRARTAAMDLLQHVGLGGTPIDVDAMVEKSTGCRRDYSGRPWENDAFFCGDMATAYWNEGMGLLLKTFPADQCSRIYEFDYSHSGYCEFSSDRTGGGQ